MLKRGWNVRCNNDLSDGSVSTGIDPGDCPGLGFSESPQFSLGLGECLDSGLSDSYIGGCEGYSVILCCHNWRYKHIQTYKSKNQHDKHGLHQSIPINNISYIIIFVIINHIAHYSIK